MSLKLKTINDKIHKIIEGIYESFFPSIYKKIKTTSLVDFYLYVSHVKNNNIRFSLNLLSTFGILDSRYKIFTYDISTNKRVLLNTFDIYLKSTSNSPFFRMNVMSSINNIPKMKELILLNADEFKVTFTNLLAFIENKNKLYETRSQLISVKFDESWFDK